MKYAVWFVRLLFAAWMIPAGLNHFLPLFPQPMGSQPLSMELIVALLDSRLFDLVKAVELIAGIGVLFGFFTPLVLLICLPVSFGVFYWDAPLEGWSSVAAIFGYSTLLSNVLLDQDTMNYASQFAETGHLCVATLHANSANQALDRIINFFAEERRHQLLMDLSLNITAMISQRLLPRENKMGRVAAMEIMLASPLISDLIFRGEVAMIKDIMAKSTRLGMQTFDQALFQLYEDATISYEEAMRNADSKNELRLKIKLQSKREGAAAAEHGESLQLAQEEKESRF
jgi:uncharacterized membrane protein YphA (DoxX/SURF4 family)